MGTKPKEIDSDAEFEQHAAKLHSSIGQEVPLSHYYVRGAKPILVAIPTSGGDGNHGSQELAEFQSPWGKSRGSPYMHVNVINGAIHIALAGRILAC